MCRPSARSATIAPILPQPMMPSVLPVISTPMKRFFSHLPAWVEASACGIWRASESISVTACSAVVIELPKGVFITMMPLAVAAGISTLSTPMPARPTTLRFFARSRIFEVTLVAERTASPSKPLMASASFSLSLPRFGWKSTSTPRSLKICTAAGDNASEMSTLGLVMSVTFEYRECLPGRSAAWREEPGSILRDGGYGSRLALRLAGTTDAKELRRLRKLRLGLGESPIDPLGEQRNVARLDRGAAPDAQARRRIAMTREIETGAFLLDQTDHLLDEVDLR